jgi:putative peptidoglycan lipid II flippase
MTGVLGGAVALPLRDALGYSATWGAFGLTASAGFAAWIEFLLLRRWLGHRIGDVPIPVRLGLGALAAALASGGLGYGAGQLASALGAYPWASAIAAIGVFGAAYLGITSAAHVPEASAFTRRLRRPRRPDRRGGD